MAIDISGFPVRSNSTIETPASLTGRGFSLRHARDSDIPRLRLLYADTRAEEMSSVPWLPSVKQQFLDQQFNLQHLHYLKHYPEADFLVIEREAIVVGRYYISRTAPDHLIIDICFMADQRGLGMGRALIEASQREATLLGHGMHLHVIKHNTRARRLYEKLGFKIDGGSDMHHHMCWHDSQNAT
jgi:ribosomal protein S18 acetylase RimI-like enzyme